MKSSSNQIKDTVESSIDRLNQAEERLSGIKYKVKEILHSSTNEDKTR